MQFGEYWSHDVQLLLDFDDWCADYYDYYHYDDLCAVYGRCDQGSTLFWRKQQCVLLVLVQPPNQWMVMD